MPKLVTQEMKNEIIKRYPTDNTKQIAQDLDISYHTVMGWARKLRLKKQERSKSPRCLTDKDERILLEEYPTKSQKYLCKKLNKNWHAIQELARKRKIRRKISVRRCGTLEPLLNDTLESYYWLGLIIADGYISKDGHFMLSQSEKDKDNVYRLARYLKSKVYSYKSIGYYTKKLKITYRVNIYDKKLGLKIRNMLGLSETDQKTYTKLDMSFIPNYYCARALLCGIIDGDGYRATHSYRIMCHKSQLDTFIDLQNKLDIPMNIRLVYRKDKNETYCVVSINNKESQTLRQFAKSHKLPVSTRKFAL